VRDERGMITVVAIPMALIALACLCFVVSVGDAIVYRERLQDAADATAFEGAVLHARAMNAVAALNGVAAALASARGTLTALQTLAVSRGDASLLRSALSERTQLAPRMAEISAVIRDAQLAVVETAPAWALERASADNSSFYRAQGAAQGCLALSHAGLGRADQRGLTVARDASWQLEPAVTVAPVHELAATGSGSLPFVSEPASTCFPELGRDALSQLIARVLQHGELAASTRELATHLGQQLARDAGEGRCEVGRPIELDPDVQNGNVLLQNWSIAHGQAPERSTVTAKGMRMLRVDAPVAVRVSPYAFAQAEYFFDCATDWADCQADAAWQPRWSARLRRFYKPAAATHARSVEAAFQRAARRLCARLGDCEPPRPYVAALFGGPETYHH